LLGVKPLPANLSLALKNEKDVEVIICVVRTGHLWLNIPGALQWVSDMALSSGPLA
jgi:hypothetical protein